MAKLASAFLASALVAVPGARIARTKSSTLKTISGVPVLNYDQAYAGRGEVGAMGLEKEQWVIVAEEGKTDDDQLSKACQAAGACVRVGHPGKGGVPFFVVHGTERDLEDVVRSAEGKVKFIEPDTAVQLIPDEVAASSALWGLQRVGADTRATEGQGAHIYVCDTGIRSSHVDFGGRALPAFDMSSGTGKECKGDLSCAGDAQGHGTHCAGTAGGSTYGVAPKAAVHAVKVLSDSGSGSWSWSYEALDWLATSGERPAVASMSLGGRGTQSAMEVAVTSAVNAGVTVVVAGGNENDWACRYSPAFVPAAITVGSTDSNDRRSSFSNFGPCTNIWAPGSSITSAGHRSDTGSETFSGTSMACPHVSGGVALLLGSNPSLKSAGVLESLLANAEENAISGLKSTDVNAFLWVGSAPAPVPAPMPPPAACPDFAATSEPDKDGDCKCPTGTRCTVSGTTTDCPTSAGIGGWYGVWFSYTCSNCQCLSF